MVGVQYTDRELYKYAKENYQTLIFHCVKLNSEGYWSKPEQILKQTIQEQLDLYLQALLVMCAVSCKKYGAPHRHFVRSITDSNPLGIGEDERLSVELVNRAKKVLAAPPILLQLISLRDREKHTQLSVMFMDTMINIVIALSYLEEREGKGVVNFLREYIGQIKAFLGQDLIFLAEIDEHYVKLKIQAPTFKTGYMNDEKEYAHYIVDPDKVKEKTKIWDEPDDTAVNEINDEEEPELVSVASGSVGNRIEENRETTFANDTVEEEEELDSYIGSVEDYIDAKAGYTDADEVEETDYSETQSTEMLGDLEVSDKNDAILEPTTEVTVEEKTEEKTEHKPEGKVEPKKPEIDKEEIAKEIAKAKLELEEAKDAKRAQAVEKLMDQLNELVGLEGVKSEMQSLVNLIKVRKMRQNYNLPQMEMSYHMVFTGGAGTGKTTVARLVSEIYKELGVLSKGTFVETDRAGLVAGYLGQTAMKVKEVVNQALGGVLFIDEAYSLSSRDAGDDYGIEAIDTLVKEMEDHRNDLVVIVAGYQKEMDRFLKSNTGLISRFNKFIDFPDYTNEELVDILKMMADKSGMEIEEDAIELIAVYLECMDKKTKKEFGNARGIRNLFERIVTKQADRIVTLEKPGVEDLKKIIADDVDL